jgi:hypothetical protein
VKFWNPILIVAFSGSLFLFIRAFFPSRLNSYHLASLNLTKCYKENHFDSTLNNKPEALHEVSLPMWALVDNIENQTFDMPLQLRGESSGVLTLVTQSLEPMTRNNLLDRVINRSFSSRSQALSNPPKSPPSYSNQNGAVDRNIYDSESRHMFDPGYDPSELEPFFFMEDSDDRGQIFALKIWLDPKYFSRPKIGKAEICQASRGVKCWPDSPIDHGV